MVSHESDKPDDNEDTSLVALPYFILDFDCVGVSVFVSVCVGLCALVDKEIPPFSRGFRSFFSSSAVPK